LPGIHRGELQDRNRELRCRFYSVINDKLFGVD
jgi:hypothetical protein